MDGLIFDEAGFGTAANKISWSKLSSLAVRTTADGPFGEDVFWMFVLDDGVMELPGGVVTGEHLSALQNALTGFDNAKIIRAMGSTRERIFRVWQREAKPWREEPARGRFRALVGRLGGDESAADGALARLAAAWDAEARRYHNLEHLAECLAAFDLAKGEEGATDVAELAIFFHDAVYVPGAKDNEAKSAALLLAESAALGIPAPCRESAAALVRSTAPGAELATPEARLVHDVDYAILGADPLRFLDYDFSVEEELAKVVSGVRFILGRGEFLRETLAQAPVYRTVFFRERLEGRTRANITAILKSPRYRSSRGLLARLTRFVTAGSGR